MRPGDIAWLTMAAAIIAYEIRAPRGELLTEAVDRYRTARPILTYIGIAYVAAHLARVWPRRIDPLTLIAERASRMAAR